MPLEKLWHRHGEGLAWEKVQQFDRALRAYKSDHGLLDFDDLLLEFSREGSSLPVKVVMIDEAQDLTRAQWAVVERAFAEASRIYVAGDDDQALYEWAGADTEIFLTMPGRERVLPVSYRLPKRVFDLAKRVISQVARRKKKRWRSTRRAGRVAVVPALAQVDLTVPGTWLLLARNRFLIKTLVEACRVQSVPYLIGRNSVIDPADVSAILAWQRLVKGHEIKSEEVPGLFERLFIPEPELTGPIFQGQGLPLHLPWYETLVGISINQREFYRGCLRGGESLTAKPRAQVSTIHGAKGREADHVVVLTDLAARTFAGYQVCPDIEHRAFYVAVTRARKNLHLVLPDSFNAYQLP